jgi:hypothetical protein
MLAVLPVVLLYRFPAYRWLNPTFAPFRKLEGDPNDWIPHFSWSLHQPRKLQIDVLTVPADTKLTFTDSGTPSLPTIFVTA